MDLRENLELIEVAYENDKKKAVMTFLDVDRGEVLEVNFNRQSFNNGKFVDDPEKAEKVDEWCKEYFDLEYDQLSKAVGRTMDVYHYDKFNSLWESTFAKKFEDEDVGQIFTAEIDEVVDDGIAIRITYLVDGELYRSNMQYSKYVEARKEWFADPVKKENQYDKFKDKFGVSVEDWEEIKGKQIMVEVKKAFNKFTYGDIKKPNWK